MRPRAGKGVSFSSGQNKIVKLCHLRQQNMNLWVDYIPFFWLIFLYYSLTVYLVLISLLLFFFFFPSKIRKMRLIKMTLDTEQKRQINNLIDSTDKHTDVPDEVTLMTVRWRVKGLTTPDGDTESFNMSKHFRRLPSQTVWPLEPIKALLLGKGVTSVALTTHNG